MTAAITFDAFSFTYPDSPAPVFERVDLEVPEGAFALVTGYTGSGKSTLLRAMNGLVPHFTGGRFSGRVSVSGRDTLDHAPRDLADVVAFVPQDPGAAFVLDRVEDELAYAMENLGVEATAMRRRVEETLDLLDIERLRDRSVRSLSGGERQRVAIAAALTPAPRVLLLDEPTSQLDPQGAEDVLAAMQRLVHDLGMTVVIAEHRLERVAGFVDLAIGCSGGSVTTGTPGEVLERVGTGPPVTRLGVALGWAPPPLTVREARSFASSIDLGDLGSRPPSPIQKKGDVVLSARRLRAAYGPSEVLHDIDLELRARETVALIGRNGAGKTTLLRCLAGLHQPSSGTVSFRGRTPHAGRDVALCPQSPETILFSESVADEVEVTLRAAGRAEGPAAVLAAFGILELAARHPRDTSAGERALIAVAAVAATGAPVLLIDEPTRGLDVEAKRKLSEFLERWSDAGNVAVLATHDVELVSEVAGRVVMLAGGEVVADGAPEDVLGDSPVFSPQMARVFGPGWLTPRQVAAAVTG